MITDIPFCQLTITEFLAISAVGHMTVTNWQIFVTRCKFGKIKLSVRIFHYQNWSFSGTLYCDWPTELLKNKNLVRLICVYCAILRCPDSGIINANALLHIDQTNWTS